MLRALAAVLLLVFASPAWSETARSNPQSGDMMIKDFRFDSGEVLPELKLHYVTLGSPKRNAAGEIVNAVLLLHGTGGTWTSWMRPSLADELFAPGAPLDAEKYFLVIPDGIGRGGSSKPSDALRMKFPHYRYADMIRASHRLLTEHLGIKHLRLVMGTSMGGMHTWMWGEMYPDFMDGLVPIASQPIAISGRNWISRRLLIEAIRNDPDWNGGNYTKEPAHYIYTAPLTLLLTESAVHFQQVAPTREAGDKLYGEMVDEARKRDANDLLYATEAILDYDPSGDVGKIKARLLAINFADDEINPPEIGVVEPMIKRIPGARLALIPASDKTHGHFTYFRAAMWKQHLIGFLKDLPPM